MEIENMSFNFLVFDYHCLYQFNRPVGRAVTHSSLKRDVWSSNLGPVKSDTVWPTARHRCDISSKEAVLRGRNDAELGPATRRTPRRNTVNIIKDLIFDLIWNLNLISIYFAKKSCKQTKNQAAYL